jgi:hypothetical protein
MAKKNKRMQKGKPANSRSRGTARAGRGRATRGMRTAPKLNTRVKAAVAKAAPKPGSLEKSASANRSEGLQLYKLAGRPTREQFQLVYGPRGHLMTWTQRAEAGIPAEKFQAALASAVRK